MQQIAFRSPTEFADQLAVHVNHLNRALKETTGKTTSQVIAERVGQEPGLCSNTPIGTLAKLPGVWALKNFPILSISSKSRWSLSEILPRHEACLNFATIGLISASVSTSVRCPHLCSINQIFNFSKK